jgi:hypothetical protein
MTDLRTKIAEMRKLADGATPGPWVQCGPKSKPIPVVNANGPDGYQVHSMLWVKKHGEGEYPFMLDTYNKDAAFIAASREGLPWALEQLETAIGLLEECVTGPVYVDMVMAEKMRDFLAGRKP